MIWLVFILAGIGGWLLRDLRRKADDLQDQIKHEAQIRRQLLDNQELHVRAHLQLRKEHDHTHAIVLAHQACLVRQNELVVEQNKALVQLAQELRVRTRATLN